MNFQETSNGHFEVHFITSGEVQLFTVVCLPQTCGTFPTVICRSPYVDEEEFLTEDEICRQKMEEYKPWLAQGYAVVFQHCRGRGKSSGDCVPYLYEREDGLCLQAWIRRQPFYNGELYLYGASYTTSVHYVTAPFAADIKGAVLEVQDCERYNCNYRNGIYKMGLHGNWYVGMYKRKSIPKKPYSPASFHLLPLCDFSKTVFGEPVADFDEVFRHPDGKDPFWDTHYGGGETRGAVQHAGIPVLLVTGHYDIFTGGIYTMWKGMDDKTKAMSALAVHPYGHFGKAGHHPLYFENGDLKEAFGDYAIRWINAIRGKEASPFEKGKITYYRLFGETWCCDDFYEAKNVKRIPLGNEEVSYRYNPFDPASFKGGLSTNFGGNAWQDPPHHRHDIISLYTEEFTEDTVIKGQMKAKLTVKSSCEDTCFYLRLSLCKEEGDYGLRDDINQISNFCPDYVPGDLVGMDFTFDEHVFVVHKGEKLRMDISSSAYPYYVRHTNQRGLFSVQETAKVADNTVLLQSSWLELPTEKEIE